MDKFEIRSFFIVVIMCLFAETTNASSQKLENEDAFKSGRSELVSQEAPLSLWMDVTFKEIRKDFEKAVSEVNDMVENNQPIERMGKWYVEKKTNTCHITIICNKVSKLIPLVASKRSFYKDDLSGEEKETLEYQLHYSDGKVISFTKSHDEGLVFYEDRLEGYYFELNENRIYETQFNEKEKFVRSIIRKPRNYVEEKTPEYELYFPEKTDLDIVKNKLLHRLKISALVSQTKEIKRLENVKSKSIKEADYDIDFNGEGKVARFHKKSTGEEIKFYLNGKIESFSLPLSDGKEFTAIWDEQGENIKEGIK